MNIRRALAWLFIAILSDAVVPAAMAQNEPIGIIIMHGKGGSPSRWVSDLATSMERSGYLVANLEMPWSGRINFSLPVSKAEEDIDAALKGLRAKGAKRVFISGHSLGGAYALYLASRKAVDGVIIIAPGGNINNPAFRKNIADTLAHAEKLVAEGKGGERTQLQDYEAGKGHYPIDTIPAHYLSWHAPDGPFNMTRAAQEANPRVPVLFIIPTRDYPGLLASSPAIFRMLPPNPLTQLVQPEADHLRAPAASANEIARWTREMPAAAGS